MDKLERLFALHALFDGRRVAVPLSTITERLACSTATAKRAIREFREILDAPLEFDRAAGGYRYATDGSARRFELPGLWFGADELAALVTLREVLSRLEPGLLGEALSPLARRLEALLARKSLGLREVARRIRVISQHGRAPGGAFAAVARAVLDRRVLEFQYRARGDGRVSERRVAPQRLTRYRGCWYLDAWCHDREALRSFALERVDGARVTEVRCRTVADAELDAHFAAAYGIFAGPATETAVLRFGRRRAARVADEVEVVGPESLRAEVAVRLRRAAEVYDAGASGGRITI